MDRHDIMDEDAYLRRRKSTWQQRARSGNNHLLRWCACIALRRIEKDEVEVNARLARIIRLPGKE